MLSRMSPLKKLQARFSPTLYVQIREHRLRVTNLTSGQIYEDEPLVAIETKPDNSKVVTALGQASRQLPLRSNFELINPFSHPRTLLTDFIVAERLMMHAFRTVSGKGPLTSAPAVVIHPMEKLDGGLTAIERKALRELAFGAGARTVTVYEGPELDSTTLDFDTLAKADPDTLTSRRRGQSPAFIAFMMVIGTAILLLSVAAKAQDRKAEADGIDCERALSTLEINDCAAMELQALEATLARYLDASRARHAEDPVAVASLDEAQQAWLAYQNAHCGAVYDLWRGGSIRNTMSIECAKALTRARTHELWRTYLTFMDSTPPVLPEPARPAH